MVLESIALEIYGIAKRGQHWTERVLGRILVVELNAVFIEMGLVTRRRSR